MLKMSKGKQHTANIENFKVILSKIKFIKQKIKTCHKILRNREK